jgi:hypothetical protein
MAHDSDPHEPIENPGHDSLQEPTGTPPGIRVRQPGEYGDTSLRALELEPEFPPSAADRLSARAESGLLEDPLAVRPDDEQLTRDVRASFTLHQDVDARAVVVETQAGEVTLSGLVDSEDDRLQVIQIASTVPGVLAVNSRMEIDRAR